MRTTTSVVVLVDGELLFGREDSDTDPPWPLRDECAPEELPVW